MISINNVNWGDVIQGGLNKVKDILSGGSQSGPPINAPAPAPKGSPGLMPVAIVVLFLVLVKKLK